MSSLPPTPPTYLARKNPHPRDSRIEFDEGPHIYTIYPDTRNTRVGDSSYTSVTTWNHTHFEQFDADRIIDNMLKSRRWPRNKYYGQTKDEIKALWETNRDEAAKAGTAMHYDIECFYNDMMRENDSIEYAYFQNFYKDYKDLTPYRTEWTIFHEELRFAGSIDMIFRREDGDLEIYDWKRSKGIEKTSSWNKFALTEEISHLPDTNYWHYALQLNIYKAILEEKYEKKVVGLYLVCLHPQNKNKNYQRIKVPNLRNEVEELFQKRYKELEINIAKEVT